MIARAWRRAHAAEIAAAFRQRPDLQPAICTALQRLCLHTRAALVVRCIVHIFMLTCLAFSCSDTGSLQEPFRAAVPVSAPCCDGCLFLWVQLDFHLVLKAVLVKGVLHTYMQFHRCLLGWRGLY